MALVSGGVRVRGLGSWTSAWRPPVLADMPWPPQLTETLSRLTSLTATCLRRTRSEALLR